MGIECRNDGIACPERACGFCHEGPCEAEAKLGFAEGERQAEMLGRLLLEDQPITQALLDRMWDSADDRVVEIFAAYGNPVAMNVVGRRRQEAIEEALHE